MTNQVPVIIKLNRKKLTQVNNQTKLLEYANALIARISRKYVANVLKEFFQKT